MNKLELLAEFRRLAETILQMQSHLQDLEMQINILGKHEQETL